MTAATKSSLKIFLVGRNAIFILPALKPTSSDDGYYRWLNFAGYDTFQQSISSILSFSMKIQAVRRRAKGLEMPMACGSAFEGATTNHHGNTGANAQFPPIAVVSMR
jgi:hypothetical protein